MRTWQKRFGVIVVLAGMLVTACDGASEPDESTTTAGSDETTTTAGSDETTTTAGSDETTTTAPEELERISITIVGGSSVPDPSFAEPWVAKNLGWWDEAGIDLEHLLVEGAINAASTLISGQADFATMFAEPVVDLGAQGEDIVVVSQRTYTPSWEILYPGGSSVSSLSEMEGRTLGVLGLASTSVPLGRWALLQAGVDPATVEFVPIGFSADASAAIAAGRVDAAIWYPPWKTILEDNGVEYTNELGPLDPLQGAYPGSIVAVTSETLETRPDDLIRFLQVLNRATVYCNENVEGCIEAYVAETDDTRTFEDLVATREYTNELGQLPPEAQGLIGYSDLQYWENLVEVLVEGEWLETEPPDPATLFTNELTEEANEGPPVVTDGG